VIFAARRKRGEGMRFAWASETVPFRGRRDVLRVRAQNQYGPSELTQTFTVRRR